MPGPDPRKAQQVPKKLGRRGKGGGMIPKKEDKELLDAKVKNLEISVTLGEMARKIKKFGDKIQKKDPVKRTFNSTGGRVGYKSGSKGCKLAMKGKGRAYGKNS